MAFFSTPQHSTSIESGLWSTCPRSASSGYHTEFRESCQKHINLRCRWAVWNQRMFVIDEENSGSSTLQKKTVGLAVQILPAATRTFTKDMALSEHSRGAAWHVWIKGVAWQGNGIGVAWARRAMCESAFTTPKRVASLEISSRGAIP